MKKTVIAVMLVTLVSFGVVQGVALAQQQDTDRAVFYTQIQAIIKMIDQLRSQILMMRQKAQGTSFYSSGTPSGIASNWPTPIAPDKDRAKLAIDNVKLLIAEVQEAVFEEEDAKKRESGTTALRIANKYMSVATQDYSSGRYEAVINMMIELHRSLTVALKELRPNVLINRCQTDAKICPDGSSVGRVGPLCEFASCKAHSTSTPAVMCTMDAKICPDGSSVGRVGPKCEFAACPLTPPDTVMCTMDAKICPDGTSVGRVAPSCEFAACPTTPPKDAPACTMDAMVCPDGTVVGRSGYDCKFQCPTPPPLSGKSTEQNTEVN